MTDDRPYVDKQRSSPVSALPDATKSSKLNASNILRSREFRRDSRVPTTLSSPVSVYLKRFSPRLSPVSTTSVLPCKLHRIACRDVSQLSVLFSSSLLYDRVIRRENAGLLFSLAVVTQITCGSLDYRNFSNNAVPLSRVFFFRFRFSRKVRVL